MSALGVDDGQLKKVLLNPSQNRSYVQGPNYALPHCQIRTSDDGLALSSLEDFAYKSHPS